MPLVNRTYYEVTGIRYFLETLQQSLCIQNQVFLSQQKSHHQNNTIILWYYLCSICVSCNNFRGHPIWCTDQWSSFGNVITYLTTETEIWQFYLKRINNKLLSRVTLDDTVIYKHNKKCKFSAISEKFNH